MEKRSADTLIHARWIIPVSGNERFLDHHSVAIRDGDIIDILPTARAREVYEAVKHTSLDNHVLIPGLINTHTHAAMSLFRGLADDLPLMTWLNEHIWPAEQRWIGEQFVTDGARLAIAEMIRSGTTCFNDMYFFADVTGRVAAQAGMRAVVGEVLYDFPSPNYGPIEDGFRYTEMLIDKWRDDPLITIAVEPHSPYLCAPDLLRKAARLATAHAIPLVIHVSETASEVRTIRERHGASPVQHLADLNVLGPNLLACHCVALDATDMDLLGTHHVKVVHNPESNMKLASGIAPVPDLLARGICVALGTDGCASNNNLDLFQAMDITAKLHKVHDMDPTAADARTVLEMATREGAQAIGMGTEIGSLEVGKKADLIIVDIHKPHLVPLYHPASLLVYAAKGSDVQTVIVDGHLVVENGSLVHLDLAEIMHRTNLVARRISQEEKPL